MKEILENKKCTGCGVCSNGCPKKAIQMVEDYTGFKYPVVDNSKCINCYLCKKLCPILNVPKENNYEKPKVYACWSKDKKNREISTSGGIFTEVGKYVINNGGKVVGAAYDKNNLVIHRIATSLEELEELRQSKYIQSDSNSIYSDTKNILENGEEILFCGSPCQIAGLKNFLGKDYERLITVEFICRGMNSPKAYKSWLHEIENVENKKVKKVWFKYKINGWKKSPRCTRVDFTDNTYKVYDGEDNKFMKGYLGPNLYIRESCGDCKFNGISRQADITLADFWGIDSNLDDDKGTSMVLLNSNKGEKYFEKIRERIVFFERTLEEVKKGNDCFDNSVVINKKSKEFLGKIDNINFSEMVEQYSKDTIITKVKKMIKRIIKY